MRAPFYDGVASLSFSCPFTGERLVIGEGPRIIFFDLARAEDSSGVGLRFSAYLCYGHFSILASADSTQALKESAASAAGRNLLKR